MSIDLIKQLRISGKFCRELTIKTFLTCFTSFKQATNFKTHQLQKTQIFQSMIKHSIMYFLSFFYLDQILSGLSQFFNTNITTKHSNGLQFHKWIAMLLFFPMVPFSLAIENMLFEQVSNKNQTNFQHQTIAQMPQTF